RIYSSYWNAFECLVEAVHLIYPPATSSSSEKQAEIEEFFRQPGRSITARDIQDCFRSIIDPGFRGKAVHAFQVCFGQKDAVRYSEECFTLKDKQNRLYDIRNAINHGSIDAENPTELIRIEAKLTRLWMIVWRMFGRFLPFSVPMDSL